MKRVSGIVLIALTIAGAFLGCTTSGTISVDWESTVPAVISIHSTEDAQIFIDGERVGTIVAGETVEFTRPPTGKAMVQLQSNSNRREHREVLLVQDTIALEFFTEPVAETPSEPAASPAPTTAPAAEKPTPYQPMGAPADPKVAVRWNCYHGYAEVTGLLKSLHGRLDRCIRQVFLGTDPLPHLPHSGHRLR